MKNTISILILLLSFSNSIIGNGISPSSINYTIEKGLSSNEIYYSIQDKEGNMWFSSDNGLMKFDGYEFKNYGRKKGLSNDIVFYLQETDSGKIWMNTLSGDYFYYEPQIDSIIPYKYNNILSNFNKYKIVKKYYMDDTDKLYFPYKNKIFTINNEGEIDSITSTPNCSILVKQINKNFTLSTIPFLKKLTDIDNKETGRNVSICLIKDKKTMLNIYKTRVPIKTFPRNLNLQLTNGDLLISGTKLILYLITDEKIQAISLNEDVTSMVTNADGQIFLCMANGGGLRIYQNTAALKKNIYTTWYKGTSVNHITIDNANEYWVSTQKKGIFYIPMIDANILTNDLLEDNDNIKYIEYNSDNNTVYFMSSNGVFGAVETTSRASRIIFQFNDFITDFHFEPKYANLWITTKNNTFVLHTSSNTLTSINHIAKSINSDKNGNITLGAWNKLFYYNGQSFELEETLLFNKPAKNNHRIYGYAKNNNGDIFIATLQGLYNLVDKKMIKCYPNEPCLSGKLGEINKRSNGDLVFLTKGCGLFIEHDNDLIHIEQSNGLISDHLVDCYIDNKDNIWLCSHKGISKVNISDNGSYTIRNITIKNGLPTNHTLNITTVGDKLFVATAKGLVELNLKPKDEHLTFPKFNNIYINDKKYDIPNTPKSCTYKENNILINYSAIDFSQKGNISFRYRLHDKDHWIYTKNRTIELSSLSADRYNFELQASNSSHQWSPSKSISFIIRPPWWHSYWFKAIGIIGLISIFYTLYYYRVKELKRVHQLRLKANESEHKFLRTQMNPHFIFNSLNAIGYFINKNDKQKANNFLTDFSSLIRFNLNATERKTVPISEELKALKSLLILESQRFPNKFKYRFDIEPSISLDTYYIPPMLLQPIVENSLIHGLFHLKENNGQLTIELKLMENDDLECTITDNGIGRKASTSIRPSKHKISGIGIHNVEERIQLYNKINDSRSIKIHITDGKDGIGTTTRFIFSNNDT